VRRAEEGGAQPLSAQALGANANRRQRHGAAPDDRRVASGLLVAGCWLLVAGCWRLRGLRVGARGKRERAATRRWGGALVRGWGVGYSLRGLKKI
jgi:hypothetical protein